MIAKSCDYKKLNEHCQVFNNNELDEYLNIRLPHEMYGYCLYDILDVSSSPVKTVSFDGVTFDGVHPWVDVPWKNLSRICGKHTYKLSFMDTCNNRYLTTYVSYIIQDDNPYKPYIYMNRYVEDEIDKQGMYMGWY